MPQNASSRPTLSSSCLPQMLPQIRAACTTPFLVDNTTTDNGRLHHLQQGSSLIDNSKYLVAEALPQLARCTRSRCANLITSTVSSRNRDKSATCSTVRCCNRSKENNVTALTASFIIRSLVTSTVCCCTGSCGTNLITSMWSHLPRGSGTSTPYAAIRS